MKKKQRKITSKTKNETAPWPNLSTGSTKTLFFV